mmetsp:Transcript_19230/g.56017  ORF Transcript_19230/g.56017 Transcript_19230/m.56017 type:complete len:444 (+) Transcript_19230:411-1742(+)
MVAIVAALAASSSTSREPSFVRYPLPQYVEKDAQHALGSGYARGATLGVRLGGVAEGGRQRDEGGSFGRVLDGFGADGEGFGHLLGGEAQRDARPRLLLGRPLVKVGDHSRQLLEEPPVDPSAEDRQLLVDLKHGKGRVRDGDVQHLHGGRQHVLAHGVSRHPAPEGFHRLPEREVGPPLGPPLVEPAAAQTPHGQFSLEDDGRLDVLGIVQFQGGDEIARRQCRSLVDMPIHHPRLLHPQRHEHLHHLDLAVRLPLSRVGSVGEESLDQFTGHVRTEAGGIVVGAERDGRAGHVETHPRRGVGTARQVRDVRFAPDVDEVPLVGETSDVGDDAVVVVVLLLLPPPGDRDDKVALARSGRTELVLDPLQDELDVPRRGQERVGRELPLPQALEELLLVLLGPIERDDGRANDYLGARVQPCLLLDGRSPPHHSRRSQFSSPPG